MNKNSHQGKAKELWAKCLDFLRDNVDHEAYTTWFIRLVPLSYDEEAKLLTIEAPSNFAVEFLDEHYKDILRAALEKVIGNPVCRLRYKAIVDSKKKIGITHNTQFTGQATSDAPAVGADSKPKKPFDSHLFETYTFDEFLSDDSNMVARNVAEAVARDPKKPFNPFFVWGGNGVGKTHLINAIGNLSKQLYPQRRVLYLSADMFKQQYSIATKDNKRNDFIKYYQSIDMLIIDDVQEWAGLDGPTGTQNVFFQIFNHLTLTGRQIILSADRAPSELKGFEERILSRFKAGAQIVIEKPSVKLRRALIERYIKNDGISMADNVIDYIARSANLSVREFNGIIMSLHAHAIAAGVSITMDLARKLMEQQCKVFVQNISITDIIKEVAKMFDITAEQLVSDTRKQRVVLARQSAMYLAKKFTNKSCAHIGSVMGGRSHATVMHSIKTIEEQCTIDIQLRKTIHTLEARCAS